jgi:hypothetical protein
MVRTKKLSNQNESYLLYLIMKGTLRSRAGRFEVFLRSGLSARLGEPYHNDIHVYPELDLVALRVAELGELVLSGLIGHCAIAIRSFGIHFNIYQPKLFDDPVLLGTNSTVWKLGERL